MGDQGQSQRVNHLSQILALSTSITTGENKDIKLDKERQKWLREAMENMVVDVSKKLRNYVDELRKYKNENADDVDAIVMVLSEIQELCFDIDLASVCDNAGGMTLVREFIMNKNSEIKVHATKCLATMIHNHQELQEKFSIDDVESYIAMIEDNMDNTSVIHALLRLLSSLIVNMEERSRKFVDIMVSTGLHFRLFDIDCESLHLRLLNTFRNIRITSHELFYTLFNDEFVQRIQKMAISDTVKEDLEDLETL